MQRLFSTFANGWPGAGILLQRGLVGSTLLCAGVVQTTSSPWTAATSIELVSAAAGGLLLLGLWTPVAGVTTAVLQVLACLTGLHEPFEVITARALGGTIAMIGPGAWSIDAIMFGRKHIRTDIPRKI